ncbi:hypothetical protein MCHIJ_27600 [Mycolicibacterium chitae]|nr:hypothetical protein MCHIJ_27600 [Mycolicibacterium chitae]
MPISEGIEDTAATMRANGIQAHSTAMTALVTIEAVGTTPRCRARGGAGRTSVATAMGLNLGSRGPAQHGVIQRSWWGLTPS